MDVHRGIDEGYAVLTIIQTMDQHQQFNDALAKVPNRTAAALSDGRLRLLGHHGAIHAQLLDTMKSGHEYTPQTKLQALAARIEDSVRRGVTNEIGIEMNLGAF